MSEATVFIVDDDSGIRETLRLLLTTVGLVVEDFESAEALLESYSPYRTGCLVVDVRMPGMGGLQLQEEINKIPFPPPIIFITGHGDVEMAVRAMKSGALDFIQKPFSEQQILEAVQQGVKEDASRCSKRQLHDAIQARLGNLTQREQQVLELICERCPNKDIAQRLGISIKTVEYHRSKLMEKMHAETMLDLFEMLRGCEVKIG